MSRFFLDGCTGVPEHQLQYQLEKMRDNDYYVMIRFREPDYIFINALHLAVLERME